MEAPLCRNNLVPRSSFPLFFNPTFSSGSSFHDVIASKEGWPWKSLSVDLVLCDQVLYIECETSDQQFSTAWPRWFIFYPVSPHTPPHMWLFYWMYVLVHIKNVILIYYTCINAHTVLTVHVVHYALHISRCWSPWTFRNTTFWIYHLFGSDIGVSVIASF